MVVKIRQDGGVQLFDCTRMVFPNDSVSDMLKVIFFRNNKREDKEFDLSGLDVCVLNDQGKTIDRYTWDHNRQMITGSF